MYATKLAVMALPVVMHIFFIECAIKRISSVSKFTYTFSYIYILKVPVMYLYSPLAA
jgi:hypothetical protein